MSDRMTLFERRQRILGFLREQSGVKVTELAQLFNVSEGTIRNDLRALDQTGQLTRVRGGAVVRDGRRFMSPAFADRVRVNSDAKQSIARWAANTIEDGDAILLDASTTVFAMVPFLQDLHNLTIVTNGIEVGLALAQNPAHAVILIGGILRPDGTSVVGHLGEKILDELHIKTAFVSCSGFSVDAGLTEVDIQEVQLKRKMIYCAERVVALIDSSKFGKVDLTSFASLDEISHIFTDDALEPQYVDQLRPTCTALTVCRNGTALPYDPCEDEPGSPEAYGQRTLASRADAGAVRSEVRDGLVPELSRNTKES
jgi:DeoR/GlpR family transcriptional regulator of sugar metabolism